MQPTSPESGTSRREFLKQVAAATAVAGLAPMIAGAQTQPAATQPVAWYSRTLRWGQTNITEADVAAYDIAWWRGYWKRTEVQGVIINAGGIYAYYPSKFPLHYRAANLNGRDLYGELAAAAHEDGLVVLARMDSSKAHEALYRAHPDWFAVDAAGQPYRSGEFYLSCINGPYYTEFLPDVMREIIERSHPQGFADNGWSGLDRGSICYCDNCGRRFGKKLPERHDWDDPVYREWIDWNYKRRIEQWDFNNQVTREAGGKDCLWIGMNGSGIGGQSVAFRDMKEICARAEIFLLDNQARSDAGGFQENATAGKMIHGMLGWEKLIPESMGMYQAGRPQFRFSSKPASEARMWMLAGFAGGIQPWWHMVGAHHEDRRMYRNAEPVMRWHKENEEYLVNRRPLASVAIGWSQRNWDFFGRDNADVLVEQPMRGFELALTRARIPFVPLHLDYLDRDGGNFSTLILPNVGAMSDEQIAAVRRFVQRGGGLIASGQSSLFDERGDARSDLALADLFGVQGGKPVARVGTGAAIHTYLRLTTAGDGQRHPVLAGFEETEILPFGGTLFPLSVDSKARVLLTFVPAFPTSPPENSWMRQPVTDVPGLVLNESGAGKVAYLAADVDRRFTIDNLPDHGDLLANIVRWAGGDAIPLSVAGAGLLNCELYRQGERLVVHLVNLTSAGTWRAPVSELIAVGPIQVEVRGLKDVRLGRYRALVGGGSAAVKVDGDWIGFEIPSILDHEVVVIEA